MLRMRSKLGQKVRHFFCKREEIFIGCNSNELVDLEFLGDPKATREDFDDAVRCFETFAQEIKRIRENIAIISKLKQRITNCTDF